MEKNYTLLSEYDGQELSVMEILPEGKVMGAVQLVHGMCEHKERYREFMNYLSRRGFACIIHDHRGHGQSVSSSEDLGYMYGGRGEALVADILQIQKHMRESYPEDYYVLLGHSMGSLAVRTYLKQYDDQIDMAILLGSPSKNGALPLGRMLAAAQKRLHGGHHAGKLLEKLSFGPYALRFPKERSKFNWVCSDAQVAKEYEESPMCGFTFTVDGYEALFDLMKETYSRKGWQCKQPNLPILFISGGDDPCMGNVRKFKKTLDFIRGRGYRRVRGKIYPGMRHEVLNETERKRVYHDICTYIRKLKRT